MVAVLLHNPNVWYDLCGWPPKHFSDSLERGTYSRHGARRGRSSARRIAKLQLDPGDKLRRLYREAPSDSEIARSRSALEARRLSRSRAYYAGAPPLTKARQPP